MSSEMKLDVNRNFLNYRGRVPLPVYRFYDNCGLPFRRPKADSGDEILLKNNHLAHLKWIGGHLEVWKMIREIPHNGANKSAEPKWVLRKIDECSGEDLKEGFSKWLNARLPGFAHPRDAAMKIAAFIVTHGEREGVPA